MIKYSVIIPTFNRSASLKKTLFSLARQTILSKYFEIIVIDDGSTDHTIYVVQEFQKKNKKLTVQYVYQKNVGSAAARNTGIKMAKGEIIFFTDDDCRVPANWIITFSKIFEKNSEVVGVAGWYIPYREMLEKNVYHWFIYLSHRFFFGAYLDSFEGTNIQLRKEKVIEENFPICNGGNIAYKKSILQKVKGFNEALVFGFDDYELSQRIRKEGYVLYYLPFNVIHDKKLNFRSFLQYVFTHAKGKKIFLQGEPILAKKDAEIQMPFALFIRFKYFYDLFILLYKPKHTFYVRVLVCALLWFLIHAGIYRLPISLKKS